MDLKRMVFFSLGVTLLAIGAIGVVTPVLPTTPLVLAAFFCFTQSSERAEKWISSNRYFGSYIENYKTKKGIPKDVKLKSILFLWITLILSMFILRQNILILVLIIVGVAVTIHIHLLKTMKTKN